MSRGPGALQRRIIDAYPRALEWAARNHDRPIKGADMALPYVLHGDNPTETQKRSVRRALKSLRERGLIPEQDTTEPTLPAASAAIRDEIIRHAETGEQFTAETVRAAFNGDDEGSREVRRHLACHPNSMGAQFRAVAGEGRIVRTGVRWTSTRPRSTKGHLWGWIGVTS